MKSISYTYIVLLLALLSLPHVCIAQSSEGPVVLTIKEFNNASKEKQQEVINNPSHFIVVKDGQKVDVWNEKAGTGSSELEDDGTSRSQKMEMERQAQQKAETEYWEKRKREEALERQPEVAGENRQGKNQESQSQNANGQLLDDGDYVGTERPAQQPAKRNLNMNQPPPSDEALSGNSTSGQKGTPISADQTIPEEEK